MASGAGGAVLAFAGIALIVGFAALASWGANVNGFLQRRRFFLKYQIKKNALKLRKQTDALDNEVNRFYQNAKRIHQSLEKAELALRVKGDFPDLSAMVSELIAAIDHALNAPVTIFTFNEFRRSTLDRVDKILHDLERGIKR